METRMRDSVINIAKLLLILGAVYFFLRYLCPITAPFLVAAIFVMIFGPMSLRLQEKLLLPRTIWIIFFLIGGLLVISGLFLVLWLFITENMPVWMDSVKHILQIIPFQMGETETLLTTVLSGVWPYMLGVGKGGAFLVTFVIASVFFAREYDLLLGKMLDNSKFHMLLQVVLEIVRYVAIYVKAQARILFCICVTCCVTLGFSGVENGIFYGLLAGVLDALPFIGTGIVLLPLSISLFMKQRIVAGIVLLLLYVTCIFIREFLEPRLIGRNVGMSPLLVLLSIYVGVSLFGLWGILKGPLGFLLITKLWEVFFGEEADREDR